MQLLARGGGTTAATRRGGGGGGWAGFTGRCFVSGPFSYGERYREFKAR